MNYREYKRKLKKEYKDTFSSKKIKSNHSFHFKLRYAFIGVFAILFVCLLIEHISVYQYNSRVEKHNSTLNNEVIHMDSSTKLTPISTKKDYETIVLNYKEFNTFRSKKKSTLTKLFSFQFLSCSSSKDSSNFPPISEEPESPTDFTQTNVQVQGIDEADVAKSDGNYIYYLFKGNLFIYDVSTNEVLIQEKAEGEELYIYQNYIITIGMNYTRIYDWNKKQLTLKQEIEYRSYLTSRLISEYLYLTVGVTPKEDISFENCYYDCYSDPNEVYRIYRINLNTLEEKQVQLLSSKDAILYASNQNFYFASTVRKYTVISVFSHDLEPVGAICVNGYVLNQFSMDEYVNCFRVVSTDTTRNAEELNAITIFDLSQELKKVGYLDQGIGKGRQTVKSVRFDKTDCFIVTYENKDPLYEIDCSNPFAPKIVSSYEAPGYSNYLHTFQIEDKEYVLGLGYTDSLESTKISVYEKTETTQQIGSDFILSKSLYFDKADYLNEYLILSMFTNHKALFLYEKDSYLYLGAQVAYDTYLMFQIDVTASEEVITVYKEIKVKGNDFKNMRVFLIEDKLYFTYCSEVIEEPFANLKAEQ